MNRHRRPTIFLPIFRQAPPECMLPALLAACLLFPLACQKESVSSAGGGLAPAEYLLDSQPFSLTLPYLFDQGRIVVLPSDQSPKSPPNVTAETYAFSALDRFGRIYHFDTLARWWMAEGQTLPEPLPAENWDAAWNKKNGAIEVLVTAPWRGQARVQLLRWRAGRWSQARPAAPPTARQGACRLFCGAGGRWIVAGGKQKNRQPLGDGWILEGAAWKKWGAAAAAAATTATLAPDLAKIHCLIDGPPDGTVELVTQSGDLWLLRAGDWKRVSLVKMENLFLTFYDPSLNQILFVWSRGLGQDQFLWQPMATIEAGPVVEPINLEQTALVRVNEEDEGVWRGWGRARVEKDKLGQTSDGFQPGFAGDGEPAIRISGEYGDAIYRRGKIKMIEIPPRLDTLRARAAAYVPALGGVVVPSVAGLGISTERETFFPAAANDAFTTTRTQPLIDVIKRSYRFWIFKERWLEWLKPPYEIHPAIDYPNSYRTSDGRRRCLSWTFPDPGLLRYEFHEFHNQKVQWVHSPLLTLRMLPQVTLAPGEEVFVSDPVVWGDPAEVIVIGWCGRLGKRIRLDKAGARASDEAYTEVPERGFMARISALTPEEWKVTPLDLPFCSGVQLVPAPAQNSLYLLGGKIAEAQEYERQKLHFMVSHATVWQWDGEGWRKIESKGIQPRMKATSEVVYDPAGRQLLSLTPRAFYGFDSASWHCLWQRDKIRGERWPEDVGLYIHPQSFLILGAWFMPQPDLRVWKEERWVPVRIPPEWGKAAWAKDRKTKPGGPLPDSSQNLLPSTEPSTFISVDTAKLAAIRMDAHRNRDEDHLLEAYWIAIRPANQGPVKFGKSGLPPDSGK